MKILIVKMLHDIRINLVSFIAIFSMSLISLLIFTGVTVMDDVYLNQYIIESNFRDLDIRGSLFAEKDLEIVKDIQGITRAEGYWNTSGKLMLEDEVKLLISYISGNEISKLHVVDGEPYTKGAAGVWLEKTMSDAKGIKVGDICEIHTEEMSFSQEVKGLVYSPQYIYYLADSAYVTPAYSEYGFAIMDESQRPGGNPYYNELLVDTDRKEEGLSFSEENRRYLSKLSSDIRTRLDNNTLIILNREQDTGLKYYLADIHTLKAMSVIFPFIFGGISILGIISTMSRLIAKQRTAIGTMKAFGYSEPQILLHYLSYSFFLVLIGGILGAVIGYYTMGTMLYQEALKLYRNPYQGKYLTPFILVGILLLLLTTVLVTCICIHKTLSNTAAIILRAEAPRRIQRSWFEKIGWWKRLRFATQWNIRDISVHPLRTSMSILGVIGCSALLFSSFYYLDCCRNQPGWSYQRLINASCRIEFAEGTDYDTAYDYAKEYDGQMVEIRPLNIHADMILDGYFLTVVDFGKHFRLNGTNGEYMTLPENGILLSQKASLVSGLPVNRVLEFNLLGDQKVYQDRVAALNKHPFIQGISMTKEHYEALGGTFRPNYLYTGKSVPKELEERPEIISVVTTEMLRQGVLDRLGASYGTVTLMSFFAICLGVVTMLNMGSLSYSEKVRDMAVLKVLGFGTQELKRLLRQQNFYITLIGFVIGVFFGFPLLDLLLAVGGETTDYVVAPTIMPYAMDFCATFLLSYFVNQHIIAGIETVDMVEELKEDA